MSNKKTESAEVPFSGPYTKSTDVVTDKSGAKHSPMSRVRHLARMAAKEAEKKKPVKEGVDEGLKPEHNMRPGWMLKADPELAAKVKKNKEIAKARKASYGNPAAGKSVKQEGYVPDHSGQLNKKDAGTMSKLAALMAKEKAAKAAKQKKTNEELELDEAKKANTASARAELAKRPAKPLTGKDAENKKKESDDAWERLMAHAASQGKSVKEGTDKPYKPTGSKSDSPGFQAYLEKRRKEKEAAKSVKEEAEETNEAYQSHSGPSHGHAYGGSGFGRRPREDDEGYSNDSYSRFKRKKPMYPASNPTNTPQKKNVKEEAEQIDELSDKTLGNYVTAARKDRERNKIEKASNDPAQKADAHARDKKRMDGMKKAKSYLMPGTAGHAKNQARRAANEEIETELEQIEERNKENATKRKMMDASRGARYKAAGNPVPDREPEHKTNQQHNKAIGRALRNEEETMEFTQEELQLIEQFIEIAEKMNMSKASMGDVIKDFKSSSAPQFKGKSDMKRRQMAIAAKLEADRKVKKEETEETLDGFKAFMLEYESDKGGRYVHKGKYGSSYDAGSDDDDDKPASTEKRGRGRPKGSSSGARQKGSTTGKKKSGVEMTGYPLHLPNR